MRIFLGANRFFSTSDGPQTLSSPAFRLRFASRSNSTFVHVSGTKKKCTACTATPTMSWIQKFQCQLRCVSMMPPKMGPSTEPPTDEKTMKATANCCSSGDHMSAIIPSVTDPPAEEIPPSRRQTTMVPKFGASAQGICQTEALGVSRISFCEKEGTYC